MAQGAVYRWNPKTKKYELVPVATKSSSSIRPSKPTGQMQANASDMGPVKGRHLTSVTKNEHQVLTKWITDFDGTASKSKRNNNDYASLIKRDKNGNDITKTMLNEAYARGIIDEGSYRKRLSKYNSIVNELSTTPVTKNGEVVTYTDPKTGKEKPLPRSVFLANGTYDFSKPLGDVLAEHATKQEQTAEALRTHKPWNEGWTAYRYLKRAGAGTFSREGFPKVLRGAYKGTVQQAADIANWIDARDRQFGQKAAIAAAMGLTPEQVEEWNTGDDIARRQATSLLGSAFDDRSTPEMLAGSMGRMVGGFNGPANAHEAGGYIAANTLPQIGGMLASTTALPKMAASVGLNPATVQAVHGALQTTGAVYSTLLKDPIYNTLMDPMGTMRASSGQLGKESAENLAMADEMAPAARGMMDIAGLSLGLAQLGTKKLLSGAGNAKQILAETQQGIKAAQSSMFPQQVAARSVMLQPKLVDKIPEIATKAVHGTKTAAGVGNYVLANTAMVAAQEAAHAGFFKFAGIKPEDFPAEAPAKRIEHALSAASGMLYPHMPAGSIAGRFNKFQHEIASVHQARYDAGEQVRQIRQMAYDNAPILRHLVETTGMTNDQALAYVSMRHYDETGGRPLRTLNDVNNLREAQELQQGYTPTLNSPTIRRVNQISQEPQQLKALPGQKPNVQSSGLNRVIDPNLRVITKMAETHYGNLAEVQARAVLKQRTASPEKVAEAVQEKKQPLPYPSMMVDTAEGPKLAIYKPDLSGVYLTDDTGTPTAHTMSSESSEITSHALPRENYLAGIKMFNREGTARISWVNHASDGRTLEYVVRGFDRGGFIVTRSVAGAKGTVHPVTYTASRNEILRTAPKSQHDQLVKKLESVSEAFGLPALDHDGRGIDYSTTSFAGIDRTEFPSNIYVGKSATNSEKGTIPARLIHTSSLFDRTPFNTYQLPTGGIIRVPIGQDPNPKSPVLPPTEVRQRTYAGTAYEETPLRQAINLGKEGGDRNYIDINVTGEQGGTRRVFLNAGDKKAVRKIVKEFADELLTSDGQDKDALADKFNEKLHKKLLKLSKHTLTEDGDVAYRYGYTDTPIKVGDVVAFQNGIDREGKTTSVSRLTQNQIDRGVVTGVDEHGVHVKIANDLPGAAGNNGARTVLVHPETVMPIAQPHLGHGTVNVETLKSVADLERPMIDDAGRPIPSEPETASTPTEEVRVEVDSTFDGLAPDPLQLTHATNALLSHGTIQHVHDNVVLVSQDKTLTPEGARKSVTNVLNSEMVSAEHKDKIVASIFMLDHENADINSIVKINHMIDGVSDWLLGRNTPVDLIEDITHTFGSTMFSGPLARQATTRNLNTRSLEALHGWREGTRLETHVNNYINRLRERNVAINDAEAAYIVKQSRRMASIIAPLRSVLIGSGVTTESIWTRASRLSTADQQKIATAIWKKTRESGETMSSPAIKALVDSPIPVRSSAPKLTHQQFTESTVEFLSNIQSQVEAVTATRATEGARSGNVSMVDLQNAINIIAKNPEALAKVMEGVKSHDLDETQFNAYFGDMRFPNTNVTIRDVATKSKNGELESFIRGNNTTSAVIRRVGQQGKRLDITDWQAVVDPILEKMPDDIRESSRKLFEEEITRAIVNEPDDVASKASELAGRFLNQIGKVGPDLIEQVTQAGTKVQEKVQAVNPVLEKVSQLLLNEAAARDLKGTSENLGTMVEQGVRELQTAMTGIHDLNASEPTRPISISQDMFDSINATVREASTWMSEYGKTTVKDSVFKLPLISDFSVFGHTPEGLPVELKGVSSNSANGLRLAFIDMFGANISPELKAVVDETAAAYSDAWDMQAYAYALRHVDYEMKSGNVESANRHIVSLLQAVAEGAPPEYATPIKQIISDVQAGKPLSTLVNEGGKAYSSRITQAFASLGDSGLAFGRKLSTFIYTHRAAQLHYEFYDRNARLVLTAAKPSDFSPASSIAMSYASLTSQKNKNNATTRAQVNLLLHLNRSGDESRDLLSIGHEMSHGIFHTLPYAEKLEFASQILNVAYESTGRTSERINQSKLKIDSLKSTYKSTEKNLQESVANATTDAERTAAVERYEAFKYNNEVDMHGDTSHFLYTDPVVNELAASTLLSGAMNTPTIFSDKLSISTAATSIFGRVGEFAKLAVNMMSKRGSYVNTDWVQLRNENKRISGYQHRWELPYSTFLHSARDSKGNLTGEVLAGHLPMGTTLSIANTRGLKRALGTDIPQLGYAPGAKRNDPLTAKAGNAETSVSQTKLAGNARVNTASTFTVKQNIVTLTSVPDALVGKHVANYNGTKWYALDSENGIPLDRVNGVSIKQRISDKGYLVQGVGANADKDTHYILTASNMPKQGDSYNIYVSGKAPDFNSNLAGLMYNIWGKTSNVSASMVGRIDKASYDQLVDRAARIVSNVEEMPDVNVGTFAKDAGEYANTTEFQSGLLADLYAGHKIDQYNDEGLQRVKEELAGLSPDEHEETVRAINDGVDNARRAMFALNGDDVRINPYNDKNERMPTSRFLLSDDGNILGSPMMFFGSPGGRIRDEALSVIQASRALHTELSGSDYNNVTNPNNPSETWHSRDFADMVGDALLTSNSLDTFEAKLQRYGFNDDMIGKIFTAIEMGAQPSGAKVPYSTEQVFRFMHDMAKSSTKWLSPTEGKAGDFASTLQTYMDPSELHPHIGNQRAFIVNAARAYAASKNMPLSTVLRNMGNNIYGEEFAGVSAMAHLMALDLESRASAIKTYNNYEIADVMWGLGKSPIVILKHKGRAGKLTSDVRGTNEALDSGVMYYAVDQENNTVRSVTPKWNPTTQTREYILGTTVHKGQAGTSAVAQHLKTPSSKEAYSSESEQLFYGHVGENDKLYKKLSEKYDDPNAPYVYEDANGRNVEVDSFKSRLQQLQVGGNGQKTYAGTVLNAAIVQLEQNKNQSSIVVTIPLPHSWGVPNYLPRGEFSIGNKFKNFDQVLDAIESDPSGQNYHVVPRHLEIRRGTDGSITIHDMGIVGNEQQMLKRSMGDFAFVAAGVNGNERGHIVPTEVYALRRLLSKDVLDKKLNVKLQEDIANAPTEEARAIAQRKYDEFAQTYKPSIFDKVETPAGKNELSADPKQWNGRSLFSQGMDPIALADDLASPLSKDPQAEVDNSILSEVTVVHDPDLGPDQIQYDFDKTGLVQVRGGINMSGLHTFGSGVLNVVNEMNGAARALVLGGDIGVAFNQSWLLNNPLVMLEHLLDPNTRNFGPAFAARAILAAAPNVGGKLGRDFQSLGLPMSQFGDNYIHLQIEKLLSRTPGLTLDMLDRYGLNLEYLKWHREWKEATLNNPNIKREDVPINYRLTDYYGDSKIAHKILPHLSPIERANGFYRDMSALIDFQKLWMNSEAALSPEGNNLGDEKYRDVLRHQFAEAVNLLNGNQSGHFSDVEHIAMMQKAVASSFVSSRYARSRMLLNPIVGSLVWGLKSGVNGIASLIGKKPIANTSLEQNVYGRGWERRVQGYVWKRVVMGYLASKSLSVLTSANVIAPALLSLIRQDDDKEESVKIIQDNLLFNNGMMKLHAPWGQTYEMSMPGGIGRGERQAAHLLDAAFTRDPNTIAGLKDWTFKQFITNQLAPMLQDAVMANSGKTFNGEDAFESSDTYQDYRKAKIASLPVGHPVRTFMQMLPEQLSNFVIQSTLNVSLRDMFSDMETLRDAKFVQGLDPKLTAEDVTDDWFLAALNFGGSGAKVFNEDYDAWLKARQGNKPRYKIIQENKDAAEYEGLRDIYRRLDFGATVDTIFGGKHEQ